MQTSRTLLKKICYVVLFATILTSYGCVTIGYRFYQGEPLTRNDVALMYPLGDCLIQSIHDAREKEERILASGISNDKMMELLPGNYTFVFEFRRVASNAFSSNTLSKGALVRQKLTLQGGNVYLVYPEMVEQSSGRMWRPIVVKLADYDRMKCVQASGGSPQCPSNERINKLAMKYLQGDRSTMTFHPYSSPFVYQVEGEQHLYKGHWW